MSIHGGAFADWSRAMRISLQQQCRVVRDIPEALTLAPTEDDLRDFPAYIKRIAPEAAKQGIVKIVLPEKWRPEFNLDITKEFDTMKQALHRLQEGVAFGTGGTYDQAAYKKYAEGHRSEWLACHSDISLRLEEAQARGDEGAAAARLEEAYWRIVERASVEEVAVDYACNLDTKKFGTPFKGRDADRPWDLSSLGHHPLNIQKRLGTHIAGVNSPWLYFGALFTTFCWHVEDHFLYSANYLHKGASKTWYGIPEPCAGRFEDLVRKSSPQRFKRDPDLLHQLVMMVSPSYLLSQGVAVRKAVQRPGEVVVTFPRAYHSGFSHGWNCAEAVNFALMDWLPIGHKAVALYRSARSGRSPTFSHDRLLWDLCQDALVRPGSACEPSVEVPSDDRAILSREFHGLVERELAQRDRIRKAGFLELHVQKAWHGEPFQCTVCRNMNYLSFCVCACREERGESLCLEHGLEKTCPCKNSRKVLCTQIPDSDLLTAGHALRSITQGDRGPAPQPVVGGQVSREGPWDQAHVVGSGNVPTCQKAGCQDRETTELQDDARLNGTSLEAADGWGFAPNCRAVEYGPGETRGLENDARPNARDSGVMDTPAIVPRCPDVGCRCGEMNGLENGASQNAGDLSAMDTPGIVPKCSEAERGRGETSKLDNEAGPNVRISKVVGRSGALEGLKYAHEDAWGGACHSSAGGASRQLMEKRNLLTELQSSEGGAGSTVIVPVLKRLRSN
eukprot:evm.model.scf_1977.1 EVM.evm.TU.scf_1977.1   scf_1977:530-6614(-)